MTAALKETCLSWPFFVSHHLYGVSEFSPFSSAALKIKVILAEILVNYDVSYPSGEKERPEGFAFNLFTTPNPFAKLTFTRRVYGSS